MKTLVNISENKKDAVKACNAVNGFKDIIGETVTINGIIMFEKDDLDEKTGEITTKSVTAIKRNDGEFFTSISPTVKNSIDAVLEVYEPDEIKKGIEIQIKTKKSNAGREFIYVDLA